MTLYNMTELQSATNIGQFALFANNASNGMLFGFLFIGLFFIIIFSYRGVEISKSILTASFICFILSAIAVYGGYLNMIFTLGFLILTALSALFVWTAE